MKLRIFFISAAIGMASLLQGVAQTILDFSTTNVHGWTVTAGGAVNAIPFCNGNVITITSDGFRDGTFVSGGSLANFDGFWTATFAFSLPSAARSVSLSFSGLFADDRVVLELNGNPIAATGIFGPGQGSMVLTGGGTNGSYYFDDPARSGSRTVADGFNIGGQNALTAIINNTDSGIYGGLISIANSYGDNTCFGVNGSISYTLSSEAATIANVQVKQRSGTTVVDLYYDLSGLGSAYSVSVGVSSDGGASFTTPATHFTGSGVTSPTAPGAGRHIVWDAGADFPSQFSTKMRLKLAVGSNFAVSPIFTLDTRAVPTGTLTGLVQGNGTPLANAQVRIGATSFSTNTTANGRFALTEVPAGSGYLLKVSAAGFASKSVPGIKVVSGTTDVGTIRLEPLSGPFRIIPLQPDVNPVVTQVEDGGVGYRYYIVTSSDGKSPAGGVNVSLRIAGGATIPQTGDVSDTWAGYASGVSDADGIVRLRIPSASLGTVNSAQDLEVLESGTAKANFQAKVVPRQYYQVWKHKVGGGASGTVAAWKVGGTTALETELRHHWKGNVVLEEIIKGMWEAEGRAGLEISTPGIKLGSLKTGASAEAGAYLGIDMASSHRFEADTHNEVLNLYKLVVALGGPMVESDGLAHSLGDFLAWYYGTDLLQATLAGSEGAVHLGGYANGEALFEVGSIGNLNAKAGGEFDGHLGGFLGYENTVIPNERATVLGLEANLSGSVGGVIGYMKYNQSKLRGLGLQFSGAVSQTITAKAVTPGGASYPSRVEVEFHGETETGVDLSVIGWKGVTQQLDPSLRAETSETLSYALPSADSMNDLAVLGAGWELLKTGFGSQTQLKPQHADDLTGGILEAPEAHNNVLGYTRTLYAAKTWELPLDAELNAIFNGLSLHLDAKTERGAEAVLEKGQIWHSLRMPLQWYANNTTALIPSDSLLAKEAAWIEYAAAPLGWALNRVESTVSSGVQTVVSAGEGATRAVVSFGQGVMDDGAKLVSKWRNSLFGSGGNLQGKFAANSYFRDPVVYGSSSLVPSNYIYGLSGVFRFESTNAFHGTGTLTMAYTDASVAGLKESDLRIYRQSDLANGWVLVGGTVDTVSNIVTATITNLGTFAIAPPLPTGDLQLILSTNALLADGVSQMTAVATNLMLNTGGVATQQWLFTATAVGVQILNPDMDTNAPGVQFYSTNGTVTLMLRAPSGGSAASVSLGSAAGDAFGSVGIQLLDNAAPSTPASVVATAGQSRIAVSWRTNSEPDFAGYRVYYRMGQSGPPWDGTATVEGVPSPVQVGGTNWLLRGLTPGTNYFVAVSAVDTTGNESSLSSAIQVTTTQGLPAPPTAVSARFGLDETNVLMWGLSEDDGYNDRDVVRYDVLRAILPGGSYAKVGEVDAGVGLYSETNLTVGATQFVSYVVVAVGSNGLSSVQALANRLMADGTGVDNDGDGIPDWWMVQYFGHPTGQASDHSFAWNDRAGDGLSNLQKYLAGRNPLVWDNLHFVRCQYLVEGRLSLTVFGQVGHNYTLLASTNLANWVPILSFACTNGVMDVFDPDAKNFGSRFYRLAPPAAVPGLKLGLGSGHPLSSSGLDLVLFSLPGLEYRIDASGDLLNWATVTNFISTNATVHFLDSSATNYSRRFYRAVVP